APLARRGARAAALWAAPRPGRGGSSRGEVLAAAERARGLEERGLHVDVDELARLYAGAGSAAPTEDRPLPPADRSALRTLYGLYRGLRDHPLLTFKEPEPLLSTHF